MTERLTPEQQADYTDAQELAYRANNTFDERHAAAIVLATACRLKEYEALEFETLIYEARTDFDALDQEFNSYNSAVSTLMPPRSVFEATKPESKESFAAEHVWNAMSPEQKTKAAELSNAIYKQFEQYGVIKGDLRVVMTEVDGQPKFTLIHTGFGIDIGDPKKDNDPARSYESVMSKKNDALFQIEVNGVKYDTRSGMTNAVYVAKIEEARSRRMILPDSKKLSQETGDLPTLTMLTSEPLTMAGYVPLRHVVRGQLDRCLCSPDYDYRELRVCPAVEIV
ncbi:MAG TPA: hypothetical protein VNE40_02495 [Candidatus Dormibacteraeota bacterium]|nr:hypothetical protein [Candidatus Dormibacteraeota bacterium]